MFTEMSTEEGIVEYEERMTVQLAPNIYVYWVIISMCSATVSNVWTVPSCLAFRLVPTLYSGELYSAAIYNKEGGVS